MHVFNSLLPVFLLIALGKILREKHFSSNLFNDLNQITYWLALPSLLVIKISQATFAGAAAMRVAGIVLIATFIGIALSYWAAKLLRLSSHAKGAFIQGCGRANNAFVGLPVILYALAEAHPEIEAIATLSLAPTIIFYNIFSVVVLISHSGEKPGGRETTKLFAKQLASNPLIIACVIGLILQLTDFQLPVFAARTLGALGQIALPLALLSVGASINFAQLRGTAVYSVTAACIKAFVFPLIGLLVALCWPDLSGPERTAALIFLACPTAVASYVLADIFGSDKEMAGRIIVISTLLSAISLSLVIALAS